MTLADLVKQLRTDAGLTQQDVADKAGVSLGFIRDIEQGRRTDITWNNVRKLANAFGVTCERFQVLPMTETDPPAPAVEPAKKKPTARPRKKK